MNLNEFWMNSDWFGMNFDEFLYDFCMNFYNFIILYEFCMNFVRILYEFCSLGHFRSNCAVLFCVGMPELGRVIYDHQSRHQQVRGGHLQFGGEAPDASRVIPGEFARSKEGSFAGAVGHSEGGEGKNWTGTYSTRTAQCCFIFTSHKGFFDFFFFLRVDRKKKS